MDYSTSDDFEWDQAKSEACFRLRGFTFVLAMEALFSPHAKPIQGRSASLPILRMKRGHGDLQGQVDWARVDATTEEELAQQIAEDDAEMMREAAEHLQQIRQRLGLSQEQLAERIHVSVTSIRNWEQGKRYPTGAARALYRILDRQPEAALKALERRSSLPTRRRRSTV